MLGMCETNFRDRGTFDWNGVKGMRSSWLEATGGYVKGVEHLMKNEWF